MFEEECAPATATWPVTTRIERIQPQAKQRKAWPRGAAANVALQVAER